MTMLDRMRRHRDWLKWSLGLVCVAFVLFYIPDFLRGSGADAASSDTVAKVEGREITSGEFRRTYQAQLQAYRSAYGNNMSEQLLKQLGIDQQILQQMVDERAALAEADRLGISVSDEEVRQRIFRFSGILKSFLCASKCDAISASVALTCGRKLSAVMLTTASFTLSLRRRYSRSRSLSGTESQSVTEARSFSTASPRRTLSSNSDGVIGGRCIRSSCW